MNSTAIRKKHIRRTSYSGRKAQSRRQAKRTVCLAVVILAVLTAVIFLTPKSTAASADIESGRNKYYTSIYIDCGDTLWSIAEEYCTSEYTDYNEYINEVKSINNISSQIKSGSRICIPYYADEPITEGAA